VAAFCALDALAPNTASLLFAAVNFASDGIVFRSRIGA
jgi:hypothetical protein